MMHRRSMLRAAGALLLASGRGAATAGAQAGPDKTTILPLWPDQPPGGGGPDGPEEVDRHGAVSNVAVPSIEIVRPERPNGRAVLVAAGGGYKRIEIGREARPAARWLAARGVTAFILTYRLPRDGWNAGPLAPLQDAQRAMRLIRARAKAFGLDPARVGALGFSAGGHLTGLLVTRTEDATYTPVDAADTASPRPAQAALIYPIVTLEPPYDHTSTRVQLIGHHPTPAESADWSVQTHVTKACPPLFVVQAEDDPVSNIANSRILAAACAAVRVPCEMHVLASGGHGFGMGRAGTPSADWPGWYARWASIRDAEP